MTIRYLNISQIAAMFELSRPTVRKRLRRAGVVPHSTSGNASLYEMAKVGPALFANQN